MVTRLIATYDVFEFNAFKQLPLRQKRLIATYDVFELQLWIALCIKSLWLIATYDVFEFGPKEKCIAVQSD